MATLQSSSPPDNVGVIPDIGGPAIPAGSNGHSPDGHSAASAEPSAPPKPPAPEKPKITQEMIDARFENLLRHVQVNRPTEDVSLIRKAWEFCVQHHAGQERASGELYIIHPLEV